MRSDPLLQKQGGVYISYPFCRRKCTFCNFPSGVFPKELRDRYLRALKTEIQRRSWRWTPETLYVGGGSPGELDPAELRELLDLTPGRPWKEATIEAPPGVIDERRAGQWREAGFNRVSLGVQSFVREEAVRTGRVHDAETVAREVAVLRLAGLENFNIDLIAGLPGQTATSWSRSLDWVDRLEAPHVSVYMLEVDGGSRLGREILAGGSRYGASQTPTEEQAAGFYEMAVARLEAVGLQRYEISNFARPGYESAHNLKYWRLEPYMGFGADAHSFDGRFRRANVESVEEYAERLESGASPVAQEHEARLAEEKFFVGLRLREGVRPDAEDLQRFEGPIRRFLAAGLLESGQGVLRLTSRGVMLSNEVFQEFIGI